MTNGMAWLTALIVVGLSLAASVVLQSRWGRMAQPSGWLSHLGFFGVQGVGIYASFTYAIPLLHIQGSGEYALAGAISGLGAVLAQLIFGPRGAKAGHRPPPACR